MKILTRPLILASKSPRRKALLEDAGFSFKTEPVDIDENYPENLAPAAVAEYLAEKKAKAYALPLKDEILLTADTVVSTEDKILGKPENQEEAFSMLKSLSGTNHKVISGVCLKNDRHSVTFHDTTQVMFKPLDNDEIWYYIQHFKPYDKAGAYAIQEWIGMIGVEEIKGSYFNVIGLPVHKVYSTLMEYFAS